MRDWTAGYVADIGYTYGYYPELNPLRARMAFLNAGLVFPEVLVACELGFGQGMSANLHAAASLTQWYGTDFNPSQAGFAQALAAASGSGAKLYDDSFVDFCNRSDLPEFDYIGIHGIWSWISAENQQVIVDFIHRKLKVGGVLYISYNTQPGWAAMVPMRDLLTEHASTLGAEGHGIVQRIDAALEFAEKLIATNPGYARANPSVHERLKQIKGHNRNYLAHEYFNRDWLPIPFSRMAEWLSPAKLDYACSAHYLDHLEALNLTAEQLTLLNEIPDPMFRQTVRDFMVNQQFRRDYWVKGARKLNPLEQVEALRQQKVVLTKSRADVPLKVAGTLGESAMSEAIYLPILDALADHKPKALGQLEQVLKDKGVLFAQIVQALMILTGATHLTAAQDEAATAKARKCTDKLNAHLLQKARGSSDLGFLASPVTGGGVSLGRISQLFLLAVSQGKKQPSDWAQMVWQILASQGQKIIKEGKTLETVEENIAELTAQASTFADKQLAILKAMQIA
ncbi:MAG: methyltransferase regulatory domain-containing protein [Candidatus Accumulibacter phosphatis]|jgi:SAM-dependent methyltransferase|uniref:Methyltransferase n=2 Tax=Candidatus Accumulibacter TaxID=327159 RepID=A0ABX1TDA9_9PROT|nr:MULTISPECIES: methyltransferase regulatory domain-containing protein [Candidatus Accumulibacter]KFB74355.1 MAG: putative methyltransferase regulatory domain protein [Candidatus Accumulibacter phosphatis]NMQ06966.1 methyltransferase [Candidatus Accumulibacter contiguus]HRF12708.1 methyltransferase regulatory domain-containing protein [Candidatus Accumulibacter phosphatis]